MDMSPELRALLQKQAYGHVVTFNRDGSPQVSLVWMDVHNDRPSFNTNTTRQKGRNLARDPHVIVSVQDPDEPMLYALIEGTATLTTEGALEHVNQIAGKFTGTPRYTNLQPGEVRVSVDITIQRVAGRGPWVK